MGGSSHLRREGEAEEERIRRATADLIATAPVLTISTRAERGAGEGMWGSCGEARARSEGGGLLRWGRLWWNRGSENVPQLGVRHVPNPIRWATAPFRFFRALLEKYHVSLDTFVLPIF